MCLVACRQDVAGLQFGERVGELLWQTESAVLDRERDGVVAALRLVLCPRREPLEQRPFVVIGEGVEHRDAELALLPHELVVVEPGDSLGVVVEPSLCLGDEDVNRSIASGHRHHPNRSPFGSRHFL